MPYGVGLADPTPERVSACPVHFVWDGRGKGRVFVRTGFLGLLIAAMFGTAAQMTRAPALLDVAAIVVAMAAAAYLVGQALSFVAKRRF